MKPFVKLVQSNGPTLATKQYINLLRFLKRKDSSKKRDAVEINRTKSNMESFQDLMEYLNHAPGHS